MKQKSRRWWIGPVALAAIATCLGAFPFLRPTGTTDLGPLDLGVGASREVEFSVGYADRYSIGIEMDQRVAKRLYPCIVDLDACALSPKEICAATQKNWPVHIAFKLIANGKDVSRAIDPPIACGGGRYGGYDTYTWQAAFAEMRPGTRYRLSVRSLTDGSALYPARPRLVVSDDDPGFGEGMALTAFAAFVAGSLLLFCAVAWALVAFWFVQRSRSKA